MTEGTIINIMESKRCKGETNCYGTFFNQIYGNQLWKKLYEKEKGARIKHTCISKKKKKDASVGGDKSMSGKWILKSSRCIIVIGLLFSVTLILIVPLEI